MAIYDRQPEETAKSYQAFAIYRDLGGERTQERTLAALGKSAGYMRVLQEWSSTYNWVARAAAYDDHIEKKARAQLEKEAVQRKVDMLKRHGMAGRLMQRKAAEYLDKNGMEKSADAINAMQKGIAIERAAEGLPEYLMEIVNADDNELARQYHELLAQVGGGGSGDETPGDADSPTASAESPAE